MTLTQTFACERSELVSTLITVTKPILGSDNSLSSALPISWRRSSSMRSVRWLIGAGYSGAGRSRNDGSTRRPAHHLLGEALDDVTFDQIVRSRQADAAFEGRGDLPDVVLHSAQRFDLVGQDDLAASPD